MPFQKGRAKTGGRKPFTKNKITRDVQALLDSLNCNPIEGMARLASDESQPAPIRARMYAELAHYVHPKLQSTQLSGPGGGPVQVEDVTATPRQRLFDRMARIAERRSES